MGGHCRSLEFLYDVMESTDQNLPSYWNNIIEDVKSKIVGRYPIQSIPFNAAIALSSLSETVNERHEYPDNQKLTFLDLEEKCLIKLEKFI